MAAGVGVVRKPTGDRPRAGGQWAHRELRCDGLGRRGEARKAGARRKQTLKNLPKRTRTALGKEAAAVRRGESPTRKQLEEQARKLNIRGRSKMGKDELKRAVARAR